MVMREPSVSTSTKQKMKALNLRPNRSQAISKEYGEMFTNIAQEKEKSHKSVVSSERLSKNERKRVRDAIFGEKEDKKDLDDFKKLELIDEQSEMSVAREEEESE
mgnify:CR=1 FL=1